MPADLDKMLKRRAEKAAQQGRGGDLYTPQEGDTVVYVCPPCREDDDMAFYEVRVHFGIGAKGEKRGAMVVCTDEGENPILAHPEVNRYLSEMGKTIEGGCPVCEKLDAGEVKGEDKAKDMRGQPRYIWNIIPVKSRTDARVPYQLVPEPDKVCTLLCGYTLWDGILDVFSQMGGLICDPDAATYAVINRKGTGKFNTEYKVSADIETVRTPMKLSKSTRASVREALKPGGTGDVYRFVANSIKSRSDVETLLSGIKVADEEDEEVANAAADDTKSIAERGPKPACFATDCTDDDECKKCDWKAECAPQCGVEVPGDGDEPKPTTPKPERKKPGPKPKPKPAPAQPATPPPEAEAKDDDGEDDDEDKKLAELEAALAKAKAKKAAKEPK